MSRMTPPDNISLDEDIRALMEDIDASMEDFERRLEAARVRQPRPDTETRIPAPLPKLGPPTQPPALPASAQPSPPPPAQVSPPVTGGLLAELEQAAKTKAGEHDVKQAQNQQALNAALDRAYRYLEAFSQHVNVLAPAVERKYRFDNHTVFENLRWQDANVKARKNSLSEFALLDFVAFRVRLSAPSPLSVSVAWQNMDAFKKEIHTLDLRMAEGMDIDGVLDKGERILRLAPDFPVQITFGANYESGRVDVLSRNLDRFGIAAFVCNPEDITQAFLDDLGRFLLARSNVLPAALQRARCHAEL